MEMLNPGHARRSLARGYARQAWREAEVSAADAAKIVQSLHDLAPNPRNRVRFAHRLSRHRGVVRAVATAQGLTVVFRTTLEVTVRRDGSDCYTEPRIAWTKIRAAAGKGVISFVTWQVHASLHAIQRRMERSDCPLTDFLADLDQQMCSALDWLDRATPIIDRDDEYLPGGDGVWAGGLDSAAPDPSWGTAFQSSDNPLPVFSIRTYLGEAEMRPTVWLRWSEAVGKVSPISPLPAPRSAA